MKFPDNDYLHDLLCIFARRVMTEKVQLVMMTEMTMTMVSSLSVSGVLIDFHIITPTIK